MRFKAHEYQRTAIDWIVSRPHCALFLDMGLGKTVVTLTALQRLMDDCEVRTALVVAPKKVAETTWSSEASKWDHLQGMRVARVMGTERQRIEALSTAADVYVIGRDSFVWLTGYYNGALPFDAIVIDELTSFKSNRSLRFKAMRVARASVCRVIGLTGTPAPNGLIDLWAQMYCVDGGERLGRSLTRYRDEHFDLFRRNNIILRCTIKRGHDEVIRGKIADICLSMQASDWLTLPPLLVHTVSVELPPTVMKGYADFERERVIEFCSEHEGEAGNVLANSAAALMNKLSQYANGAVYDEEHNAHEVHGEKLERLAEIVEGAGDSGVLVFYQYKHDVPRILQRLKGLRTAVYEGERQLTDWNAGRIDVLLAHPASTAYGLNMQAGGHYVVWFGTGWDLELYQQANARLHRQGQQYPVTVYKLVAAGTVDERASVALDGKKARQQTLLDGLNYLKRKHAVV